EKEASCLANIVLPVLQMLATVGQHVVLPCRYTTEDSYRTLNFFWYCQHLGSSFKYVLEAFGSSGDNKFCDHQFSAMVYENKTAPLEIANVSFQDTAVYYCGLLRLVVVSKHLGDSVLLSCQRYGFTLINHHFW
uniref:Ig-like domain-containing protein n=1 Tax=Pavo cristatus TaxID=9049 RepID=A0A8C9LDL4_PAVCR